MFLVLVIPAFLSPCLLSTVRCEYSKSGDLSNLTSAGKLAFADLIDKPFATPTLHLLETEFPHLLISPNNSISKYMLLKNVKGTDKLSDSGKSFSQRSGPARMPKFKTNAKDYGESSHYRMKGARQSSKKGFYMNLLQKLLRPSRTSAKAYSSGNSLSNKYGVQQMSSSMSAPGWGWGGGKGWGGGGGGHGHGYSLLDVLLCGLSLLSLGGFLLNLLLNLMNLFGFGMMTSTSTYPVTVTQTQTATATGTATGTGGGGVVITGSGLASAVSGSGLGITSRTIDSMAGNAGNGWRWDGGNQASTSSLQLHVKLPHLLGWSSTTTTTTEPPPLLSLLPSLIGALKTKKGGGDPFGRQKRRKREVFKPYVDPATALDILAKAVLNSINSAMNNYVCMENILCENNKRARVIGQWLEYFMPVYSFTMSYFGQKIGAHDNLLDHIRAIVLGATETNCQAHFPRCEEATTSSWDGNRRP